VSSFHTPDPSQTLGVVDQLTRARETVRAHYATAPQVGLVLGSGLGDFVERIGGSVAIAYGDIPGMPVPHVAGHAGRLVLGQVAGVHVACLAGRAHLYEGHSPQEAVFGVRLLAELGCSTVLVTNAAGGINLAYAPGTLMLITDHINLTGHNPLVGLNDERLGPRFPDLSVAYDADVRQQALLAAQAENLQLSTGVYAGVLGPSYETPAEVRMLGRLGADAVGMSTVLEVIALRHRGVRVGGLSCITNCAAGISATLLDHSEVQQTAARVADQLTRLMEAWIQRVAVPAAQGEPGNPPGSPRE
jgi:purine-nucleoside phosphorylase